MLLAEMLNKIKYRESAPNTVVLLSAFQATLHSSVLSYVSSNTFKYPSISICKKNKFLLVCHSLTVNMQGDFDQKLFSLVSTK